ncbi:MAG: hypothetical protein RLZZ458_982 [Planctomycetota bacterium]
MDMVVNLGWEAGGVKWKVRRSAWEWASGSLDVEVLQGGGGFHDVADVEGPEFGVAGGGAVEAHGVDDVFDVFGGA